MFNWPTYEREQKCPLKLEKICRIPEKAVEIFFIVKLTDAAKPTLYELHPTLQLSEQGLRLLVYFRKPPKR